MRFLRLILTLTAVVAVTLVVFLLLAELITSRTKEGNAVDFVRDPDLMLVRRPNAAGWSWMTGTNRWVPVNINRHNMRDAEIPEPKADGEFRILCVGDSFTYGGGLAQEETFPSRMQERYGPPEESSVRVLNGGANGWTTRYQRIFIEKKMDALQPDVVLLAFNWNDLWATGDFTDEEAAARIVGDGCWLCQIGADHDAVRATHLYRFLHNRLHGARRVPTPDDMVQNNRKYRELTEKHSVDPELKLRKGREARYGQTRPPHQWWVETDPYFWRVIRAEVEALDLFLKERGARFVVAMMPEPAWYGPGDLPARERLVELLDHLGVPWLDLQARFTRPELDGRPNAKRDELWQEYDPVHPNQDGQKVIANAICAFLAEQGLVRPRERSAEGPPRKTGR